MSDHVPPQILHVDDEEDVLAQVKEFLEGEELGSWGAPEVTSLKDFDEALSTLERKRFDLMILDVRLGGHLEEDAPEGEEEEGIRTLDEIRSRRFLPVIFWTGLPAKVSHLTGHLVRVASKDDSLGGLLRLVGELFETGLPEVNRTLRHLVEEEQRTYMWDFVAQHWDELREGDDHAGLAYLLVRRLGRSFSDPGIARLAQRLGGPEHSLLLPPSGQIHAAEMYIVPPIPESDPAVAELVRDNLGNWFFTLTASCDLAHPDKLEEVLLAICSPAGEDRRIIAWREADSSSTKRKVERLVRNSTGGQDDRWLFLPSAPTIPDLVADFQRLASIPIDDFKSFTRVASLASPFAEAAVNRFNRYYGRIGTDDLDIESVMTRLAPPNT